MKKLLTLFLLVFFISSAVYSEFSQIKMDSLKKEILKIKGEKKLKLLVEIANDYIAANADSSFKYARIGIFLSEKENDSIYKPDFYRIIGKNYSENRNNKLALTNYHHAALLYETLNNTEKLSEIYNSIGAVYGKIYSYDKALFYIHKSISILIKTDNYKSISSAFNNLGVIYRGLKDIDKSIEIFQQALYFANKSGNELAVASSLNNLSISNIHKKKYNNALKYQLEAIKIFEKLNNKKRLCSSYISVGIIYKNLNQNTIASRYYLKSLKLAQETNDKYLLSFAYQNLGSSFLQLKKFPLALEYLTKSKEVAYNINDWVCMKSSHEAMSEYFVQTGDYKKALEHYKKFKDINDSIYNKESNDRSVDLQVKYEVEEKDKENEILKQQSTIQHLEIQKQIYLKNLFIAISCLVILLVLFYMYRFFLKRKANRKLSEKNELITIQKEKLEAANATKDKFFSLIAHDLKTPFYVILRYTQLLKNNFYEISDAEKKENIDELYDYTRDIYFILENLLTWSRSQRGIIHVKKEEINLKILIENSIRPYLSNAKNKSLNIIKNIDESTMVFADNYTLSTTIGNLFNNAVKFTASGGSIFIESEVVNKDEVSIIIRDTGVGINEADIKKLFQVEANFSTEGTENEKGTGLGLIICKEFIEYNNGRISVESKPDEGSKFSITLPAK